jgi:hypothetical protein
MSNLSPLAITLHQCHAVGGWERVAAEVERMVATWRPISEAPRDGTTVFGYAYKSARRGMVSFNGSEWEMVNGLTNLPMGIGFYPTHWTPLLDAPPPPASRETRVADWIRDV